MPYDTDLVWLPDLPGSDDFRAMDDVGEVWDIAAANTLKGTALTDRFEITLLVAFLRSLTDRDGIIGRLGVPESVPSGLPGAAAQRLLNLKAMRSRPIR